MPRAALPRLFCEEHVDGSGWHTEFTTGLPCLLQTKLGEPDGVHETRKGCRLQAAGALYHDTPADVDFAERWTSEPPPPGTFFCGPPGLFRQKMTRLQMLSSVGQPTLGHNGAYPSWVETQGPRKGGTALPISLLVAGINSDVDVTRQKLELVLAVHQALRTSADEGRTVASARRPNKQRPHTPKQVRTEKLVSNAQVTATSQNNDHCQLAREMCWQLHKPPCVLDPHKPFPYGDSDLPGYHAADADGEIRKGHSARHNIRPEVSSPPTDGSRRNKRYTCKFIFVGIDLDRHADFELVPRVIGRGGEHMKAVARVCHGKVRLRGRGSGYREQHKGGKPPAEADVPLQLALSCTEKRHLEEGKRLVHELVDNLTLHFERFCKTRDVFPVPTLCTVVHSD
mmetsp:Transcript_45691/g.121174  ORF Transcript_45691/g.121174 Transcript_45691/m.121174 type:complete len:398 (-) Transcript_45691:198-1391(-)